MHQAKRKPFLVLFNGPRHSGKDEAVNYCVEAFGARPFKMSAPLKLAIKALFCLSDEEVNHLEATKTQPSSLLFGKSYVEVQISLSEEWGKVQWGRDFFGRIAARSIKRWVDYSMDAGMYVCSDSGFEEESWPVINAIFGKSNTLLVKLSRPGKSFEGDSRSYVDLEGVMAVDIANNGDLASYHKELHQVIEALVRPALSPPPVIRWVATPQCTDGFCPMPNVRSGPPETAFSAMFDPVSQ